MKKRELDARSLNVKLWCWFYGVRNSSLPNNLCPFFWKLVVAWMLVIPYAGFCVPMILIDEVFVKSYRNGDNSFGERIRGSIAVYIILFLLVCMGIAVATLFTTFYDNTFLGEIWKLGLGLWAVIIIVSIILGITVLNKYLKEKRKRWDENGNRIWIEPKEKRQSLLVQFVKAKYEKNCPRITWINKD